MKHTGLMGASLVGALAIGSRLMAQTAATPTPYAFLPPPTLPGQTETLHPNEKLAFVSAAAPSGGCTPDGDMTRQGSIVSVTLKFVRGHFKINNPDPKDPQPKHEDPVELRSYGGCQSGPALDVRPGDTLRVQLENQLDPQDPSCLPTPPPGLGVPPGVGCYNTTNLHTHGLHVSPAGNSDNVLLNISPRSQFPYEINVPDDHPSGTFWYHAHRHGSTAVQVASGASGVLVIRGDRPYTPPTPQNPHPIADIDTILHTPDGKPMPEQLFLMQQIAYACFENDPNEPGGPWQQIYTTAGLYTATSNTATQNAPWTCPLPTATKPVSPGAVENFSLQLDSPTIWDTNGRFTSINGVVQPNLTVAAGEIQRWRFVHAGIHDTINLQIVRATPVAGQNLIAKAALVGNREQQKNDLLAACAANPTTLVPQFEIASDGLTRAKLHTIHASNVGGVLESNYLQPGYRSDILVAFPDVGDYCLLDQAAPASERVSNGGGGQGPSTPQLLAYVHVRGGTPVTPPSGVSVNDYLQTYVEKTLYDANPQLPPPVRDGLKTGDLAPWAPFIEEPKPTGMQQANFSITAPNPNTVLFQINGASYDPDVVNFTRQVNTTDDWLLTAQGEPHIFHIHVNPFEVMDVTTTDASGNQISIYDKNGHCNPTIVSGDQQQLANQYCGMYHTFRDTIIVENNYQIHIRTTYDRYIGEFVLHCHILDHEDAGMMANISIVPDMSAPGHGLGMPNMHHEAAAPMTMNMKQ
jgi:FtsP/CotA-like multicopper oxidase with cupredoxin domain